MANFVALRKESVDRNAGVLAVVVVAVGSLSARRAWIEILAYPDMIICTNVALRKESVDRNLPIGLSRERGASRSPQGERG